MIPLWKSPIKLPVELPVGATRWPCAVLALCCSLLLSISIRQAHISVEKTLGRNRNIFLSFSQLRSLHGQPLCNSTLESGSRRFCRKHT